MKVLNGNENHCMHTAGSNHISRNFIVIHYLRVKLILTRETRQKYRELELVASAIKFYLYHETLLGANVAFEIFPLMTWRGHLTRFGLRMYVTGPGSLSRANGA